MKWKNMSLYFFEIIFKSSTVQLSLVITRYNITLIARDLRTDTEEASFQYKNVFTTYLGLPIIKIRRSYKD